MADLQKYEYIKMQALSENKIEKIELLTEEMIKKPSFKVENIALLKKATKA